VAVFFGRLLVMEDTRLDDQTLKLAIDLLSDSGRTSDVELVERFAAGDSEAFTVLVGRHAPTVFGVCRRISGNVADADDAFQATFLLLIRKAGSLRHPDRLAGWLHGVARRIALKAHSRRFRKAKSLSEDVPDRSLSDEVLPAELRSALDEAIEALPDRYRIPILLCHLQGLSYADVAARIGCAEGTIGARLSRARRMLRRRLERGGFAPAITAAACLDCDAKAAPSVDLLTRTICLPEMNVIPPAIQSLTLHVAKGMLMESFKVPVLIVALVGCLTGVGTILSTGNAADPPPPVVRNAFQPPPAEDNGRPAFSTKNFIVTAPTADIARTIAESAERERKEKAILWTGAELPAWPRPCPITVRITIGNKGGATTFRFEPDGVRQEIQVEGSVEQIVNFTVPHEGKGSRRTANS